MKKDRDTLDAMVEQLEQTCADYERRLAALENRLDPKSLFKIF